MRNQGGRESSPAPVQTPALVRIGCSDVAYSRRGSGKPVLLVVASAALRARTQAKLAAHFRVFAPELHPHWNGIGSGVWLREMIDGLGLDRPHVVVAGAHSAAVLHFAIDDAERVDRLVVLWRERGAETSGEPALEERLQRAARELLILRLPGPGREAAVDKAGIEAITRFLRAGRP